MSIGKSLLGLGSAPLRQWRRLDSVSPLEISKAESTESWDDLGLKLEDDELVVLSLDGTPGGESGSLLRNTADPELTKP